MDRIIKINFILVIMLIIGIITLAGLVNWTDNPMITLDTAIALLKATRIITWCIFGIVGMLSITTILTYILYKKDHKKRAY